MTKWIAFPASFSTLAWVYFRSVSGADAKSCLLFVTPWSKSLWFQQEYRNGLLCPPPGDLPTPGIKSISAAQILYHWATWEALALEDVPQIYTQGWSRRSSTYRQYLPFRPCPEGTTSSFNSWVSPLLLLQLLWAVSFHSLFLDHTPCDVLGSASFSFP